jgi:hypothetical protein
VSTHALPTCLGVMVKVIGIDSTDTANCTSVVQRSVLLKG